MEKIILEPLPTSLKCEIYFGLKNLLSYCTKKGAILADETIANSHGASLQKMLSYDLISVPSGEKNKTRENKEKLEDELLRRKFGKDSTIIALGGGVITDLVGFLAATYMRGVPLILIPTTLLGMVDAAIGGKTAVDTPFGKNLIGAFYLPKAIFIDETFLKTLPEKQIKAGLSEVLKMGLIDNPQIWENHSDLAFVIKASIQSKVKIVQADFEEKTGLRRILNFGHTVGHALELISNYKIEHGEAVALGCMAESYLSFSLGYLPDRVLQEILSLYRKLGYAFKKFDRLALLEALKMDKKAKNGIPRFVIIDRIGHCEPFNGEYCTAPSLEQLKSLLDWMIHGQR